LYWALITPLFVVAVYSILRMTIPVTWDGGGPMPDFYWGEHPPAPTISEYYYKNQSWYESKFRRPYWIAADNHLAERATRRVCIAVVRFPPEKSTRLGRFKCPLQR
jgi:hypothetical protein